MRLVAHVARRYRNRGVAYSDLVQDGFCGLLQAIDRFDLRHQTKLATYATWWIRQAIQSAVAAGAPAVRLTPAATFVNSPRTRINTTARSCGNLALITSPPIPSNESARPAQADGLAR